jgi:hypothetical protein
MKFWLSDQDVMHKTNMTTRETIVPIAAPTIPISGKIKSINQEIIDDDIDDVPNDSSPHRTFSI